MEVISQPGGSTEAEPAAPSQSGDRTSANFEPSQDEQTVVADWLRRVTRAEDDDKAKKWRDDLARLRRYERGTQTVDDKQSRTNMVYATIAAQIPELYAKNPTIAVTPTDAVTQADMGKIKRFASTAEKVVRKMLVEEGKLKKRAKANIRATSVTSFGVLKVLYQKEYRGDPIALRRIDDTQDNLAKIEVLVKQIKKSTDVNELARKRDDLHANLKALTSGNEISIYKGFVIDRMKSEDFVLLDDNVDEFDEYLEARAMGHKIWMTVGEGKRLFKMETLHGATRYGRPRSDANNTGDNTTPDEQYICVVEIWDKENGVVRTTAKGMNRWLREPYAPTCTPQRWYPFYVLGFNLTEGEWRPISDVELLASLQDEYDRTRQNYADVREKAVPILIGRKSGNLTEEDVKAVTNRANKDTIMVEGNPTVPLGQDLMWFEGAKIDPAAYDVSMIRNDMDLVSGRSDASRANLIKPKTATEAEIMQEAMQSRVGERRDAHEDLLSEMAEAALEVALRDLSKAEVQQLAGADAEWPENPQSVETIFRMVSVKVRAGSSGKPNQQREREQWGQLLPMLKDTMQGVAELRMQGNYDQADALLELMRETLRRFDEHLDLDAIIPPIERDENGQPIAQQQAAMELVQVKEQLAQCKEELAKCQEDLAKAKAGEAAKVKAAELDAANAAAEASRKAQEQAVETERQQAEEQAEAVRANALKVAQEASKAEAERTKQLELDKKDKLERSRMDKEFDLKKDALAMEKATAIEIAEINAKAKGEKTPVPEVQNDLTALVKSFKDFLEADRIVDYGPDGMPTGMRVVKKPAKEKAH